MGGLRGVGLGAGPLCHGGGLGDLPEHLVGCPAIAARKVGDAYGSGTGGLDAFDCPGLTKYAYAAAGMSRPHSSRMQATMGTAVSRGRPAAG